MDASNSDEYFVTALQIFNYCGAESTETLRVDALMDKFAPFIKTNKAEFCHLRSALDPEHDNPEISVNKLAKALNKYSESQKAKVDLDESFNLKSGQVPQDSDSGISTDGFQLLEELQCELREKAHLAAQLRSQLDFTDHQHEEALAAGAAERDELRAHLNTLREENLSLAHLRRDYEESCERLAASEGALDEARRELDCCKKKARLMQEQVAEMENEKLSLQELLSKSREECHRINEMYASRQSSLLEENDTLKTEHADLSARLQDHEEFMQQMIKEKVLLEMELKDVLNKSNQTHLRMDRSIDISYTEDQMLTALDSLNADSRFPPDNRILDEEAFVNALKEEQGRTTNMSLFDEIRLSFNISRHNTTDAIGNCEKCNDFDTSMTAIGTQTNNSLNGYDVTPGMTTIETQTNIDKDLDHISAETQTDKGLDHISAETQTDKGLDQVISAGTQTSIILNSTGCQTYESKDIHECQTKNVSRNTSFQTDSKVNSVVSVGIQTDERKIEVISIESQTYNLSNDNVSTGSQTVENNNYIECYKCLECDKMKKYNEKLVIDLKRSQQTINAMNNEFEKYDDNLRVLEEYVNDGKKKNSSLQDFVEILQAKLCALETACESQKDSIVSLNCETCCALSQTDRFENASVATQVDVACTDCEKRKAVVPHKSIRKYLWEPLKCLFQVFAVLCFICAISLLYGVSRRWQANCGTNREAVPWRWLDAHDLMDLLLRIEYVADVPM